MRRILAIGALWAAIIPQAAAAAPPTLEDAARWKGRYCTVTSCAALPQHPWSAAIGFGAATFAAGWIGRRRNLQNA